MTGRSRVLRLASPKITSNDTPATATGSSATSAIRPNVIDVTPRQIALLQLSSGAGGLRFARQPSNLLNTLQNAANGFADLRIAGPDRRRDVNVSIRIDRDQWSFGSAKNYFDGIAVFLRKMKENSGAINYFKECAHNKTPLKIFRQAPDEQ